MYLTHFIPPSIVAILLRGPLHSDWIRSHLCLRYVVAALLLNTHVEAAGLYSYNQVASFPEHLERSHLCFLKHIRTIRTEKASVGNKNGVTWRRRLGFRGSNEVCLLEARAPGTATGRVAVVVAAGDGAKVLLFSYSLMPKYCFSHASSIAKKMERGRQKTGVISCFTISQQSDSCKTSSRICRLQTPSEARRNISVFRWSFAVPYSFLL